MTTPPAVQAELDGEFARSHHSSNLVNVPPMILGGCRFNDEPVALHIAGVQEFNRGAFEMFAEAETPAEAADAFENYMHAAFGIDPEQRDQSGARRRFRSSYLRLLRGWAYDANSPEGAVLKGWVESRFGLLPTFHKQPIDAVSSGVWAAYVTEKMSTRFHDNSIYARWSFCSTTSSRSRTTARLPNVSATTFFGPASRTPRSCSTTPCCHAIP
jgi:NAD+--dinitrogen-reductase ADP-D-ribosyltransferase